MTYRFDPAEFAALRQRLRCPPNAVPDTGINLPRPDGVTGYELERRRRVAIMQAEADRKARLAQELKAREERQHIKEMRARTVPQAAAKVIASDSCPSIYDIIGTVCALVGMSDTAIKSERRDQDVVCPRFVAMMLAKMLTLHSLPSIGRHFGGRDHTTVLHAVRKMEEVERMTLAAVQPDATLHDYAVAALRSFEVVFPGRSFRITEAVHRLEEAA